MLYEVITDEYQLRVWIAVGYLSGKIAGAGAKVEYS